MESNGYDVQKPEDSSRAASTEKNTMQMKLLDHVSLCIPPNEDQIPTHTPRERRFLDFLKVPPSRDWLPKLTCAGGTSSPFSYVKRLGSQRTRSIRNINWQSLLTYCKTWAKHPMNMALLVWLLFVAAGLLALLLLMAGLLNDAIPSSSQRKRWTEITNQILNALFTIMCIYQHPRLLHHLLLLCRWRPTDVVELRQTYCKAGAQCRSSERAHMAFVVSLLHVTCLSQYGLCGLYWGYSSDDRPTWPQVLLVVVGIVAPVTAAVYVALSPLGRKCETKIEEERQIPNVDLEKNTVEAKGREWAGGLFDCWDDPTAAALSFVCTFCVFGWNMERLGFGHMYVHVLTFALLCVGPLLVFSVTAVHVEDDAIRYVVGVAGAVLCFCGLLYGGFWRTRVRRKFGIPGNPLCCGYPAVTDFLQWLFCSTCALAQEVRTGNFIEIEKNRSSCMTEGEAEETCKLRPLPREGELGPLVRFGSLEQSSSGAGKNNCTDTMQSNGEAVDCVRIIADERGTGGKSDTCMNPPDQPVIHLESKPRS